MSQSSQSYSVFPDEYEAPSVSEAEILVITWKRIQQCNQLHCLLSATTFNSTKPLLPHEPAATVTTPVYRGGARYEV